MSQKTFNRALLALAAARLGVLAVCAFLPLSLPGIWRQTDTLGVALRYWLRWTVEAHPRSMLLPAVLNSGDTSGIMPMEFPALNLVAAPLFALGPYWGRVAAMLGILALVHGLIYLNYRVLKPHRETLGVSAFAFVFIAVATFSSGWTGKFIPDLVSVLLVLLGVGLSWEKPKAVASGLTTAFGLLMKPTSVVVLALFLAHPQVLKKVRANFAWGIAALAVAALYYTKGLNFIAAHQDGPGLFWLEHQPFLKALKEFFADVHDWTNMWMYRPFFSMGSYLIIPLSIYALATRRSGRTRFAALWGVLLLQYVIIAGLAGTHGFVHDYYFLGLAPTCALILGWLIEQKFHPVIPVLIFLGILVPTIELSSMDLRPLYKAAYKSERALPGACAEIRARHPEAPWGRGEVFRSTREPYPALGICFGEREGGDRARYGFFWNSSPLPPECHARDSAATIIFAECGSG